MDLIIRDALPQEAFELTAIALQAKGHWGYTAEQIERWRTEFLTVTPDYIQVNRVWVAAVDAQQLAGFAAIEQGDDAAILEHLWVLPDFIGRGIGKRLFLHVAAAVSEFVFTSDPHADVFYLKMGAQQIGEVYSELQQTTLTKFRYGVSSG
jgi:GNAT superfamily N-acetyltransferase